MTTENSASQPVQAEQPGFEQDKLKLEWEKLALERDKLEVERVKTRWTVASVLVSLLTAICLVGANIRASNVQAQSQLELQAAQIAMDSQSAAEFEGKRQTLAALFPDRFGKQFQNFNPESFVNYGTGDEAARRELFHALVSKCRTKAEVLSIYNQLFPTPDGELNAPEEWRQKLKVK